MKQIMLADSEWRLMQALWANGESSTFRQLCDAVCEPNGWTKHTVMSYLKRLAQKGAIEILEQSPVKRYRPLLAREQAIREETRTLLRRVYNGDALLMVQSAVEEYDLSDEERQELIALLRRGRG